MKTNGVVLIMEICEVKRGEANERWKKRVHCVSKKGIKGHMDERGTEIDGRYRVRGKERERRKKKYL